MLCHSLSIKNALKLADEKYPAEALQWNEETIQDIKAHYEYLKNHEDIIAKIKHCKPSQTGITGSREDMSSERNC
jgi:hypothetical protein